MSVMSLHTDDPLAFQRGGSLPFQRSRAVQSRLQGSISSESFASAVARDETFADEEQDDESGDTIDRHRLDQAYFDNIMQGANTMLYFTFIMTCCLIWDHLAAEDVHNPEDPHEPRAWALVWRVALYLFFLVVALILSARTLMRPRLLTYLPVIMGWPVVIILHSLPNQRPSCHGLLTHLERELSEHYSEERVEELPHGLFRLQTQAENLDCGPQGATCVFMMMTFILLSPRLVPRLNGMNGMGVWIVGLYFSASMYYRIRYDEAHLHNDMDLFLTTAMLFLTHWGIARNQKYYLEKSQRNKIISDMKERESSDKMFRVLECMVPLHIAVQRLKEPNATIAEQVKRASILFIVIADFEEITKSKSPKDLLAYLNKQFTRMDEVCEDHAVSKIETVGEEYVAAVGVMPHEILEDDEFGHAGLVGKLVQAAADIMKLQDGTTAFKMGMHTGPVVAGVIGQKLPRFRLFGDTINTAARMMQKGINGEVQYGEETRRELPDWVKSRARGQIEMKGKGQVTTYLLDQNDRQQRPASSGPQKSIRQSILQHMINTTAPPSAVASTRMSFFASLPVLEGSDEEDTSSNDETEVLDVVDVNLRPSTWGNSNTMRLETPLSSARPSRVSFSATLSARDDAGVPMLQKDSGPPIEPTKSHNLRPNGGLLNIPLRLSALTSPDMQSFPVTEVELTCSVGGSVPPAAADRSSRGSNSSARKRKTAASTYHPPEKQSSTRRLATSVKTSGIMGLFSRPKRSKDDGEEEDSGGFAEVLRELQWKEDSSHVGFGGYLRKLLLLEAKPSLSPELEDKWFFWHHENTVIKKIAGRLDKTLLMVFMLTTVETFMFVISHAIGAEWRLPLFLLARGICIGVLQTLHHMALKPGPLTRNPVKAQAFLVGSTCIIALFLYTSYMLFSARDGEVERFVMLRTAANMTAAVKGRALFGSTRQASLFFVPVYHLIATQHHFPFLYSALLTVVSAGLALSHEIIVETVMHESSLYMSKLSWLLFFLNSLMDMIRANTAEANSRSRFKARHAVQLSQDRIQNILNTLMPPGVVAEINEQALDAAPPSHNYKCATIAQSDLCGFTKLASTRTASEVVAFISDLFGKFDELSDTYEVYKVETIGDAYIAGQADFPLTTENSAVSVVLFALSMVDATNKWAENLGVAVKCRVGVHTGECVGGIVGETMQRYHLFGDLMHGLEVLESTAPEGRVQMSRACKEAVEREVLSEAMPRDIIQFQRREGEHLTTSKGDVYEFCEVGGPTYVVEKFLQFRGWIR